VKFAIEAFFVYRASAKNKTLDRAWHSAKCDLHQCLCQDVKSNIYKTVELSGAKLHHIRNCNFLPSLISLFSAPLISIRPRKSGAAFSEEIFAYTQKVWTN